MALGLRVAVVLMSIRGIVSSNFTQLSLQLACYRHSHDVVHNGIRCDGFSDCDPFFSFCLSQQARGCDLTNRSYEFFDTKALGRCAEPESAPLNLTLSFQMPPSRTLILTLRIRDRSNRFPIDELTYPVPPDLPEIAVSLNSSERLFTGEKRPKLLLLAGLRCEGKPCGRGRCLQHPTGKSFFCDCEERYGGPRCLEPLPTEGSTTLEPQEPLNATVEPQEPLKATVEPQEPLKAAVEPVIEVRTLVFLSLIMLALVVMLSVLVAAFWCRKETRSLTRNQPPNRSRAPSEHEYRHANDPTYSQDDMYEDVDYEAGMDLYDEIGEVYINPNDPLERKPIRYVRA